MEASFIPGKSSLDISKAVLTGDSRLSSSKKFSVRLISVRRFPWILATGPSMGANVHLEFAGFVRLPVAVY